MSKDPKVCPTHEGKVEFPGQLLETIQRLSCMTYSDEYELYASRGPLSSIFWGFTKKMSIQGLYTGFYLPFLKFVKPG